MSSEVHHHLWTRHPSSLLHHAPLARGDRLRHRLGYGLVATGVARATVVPVVGISALIAADLVEYSATERHASVLGPRVKGSFTSRLHFTSFVGSGLIVAAALLVSMPAAFVLAGATYGVDRLMSHFQHQALQARHVTPIS